MLLVVGHARLSMRLWSCRTMICCQNIVLTQFPIMFRQVRLGIRHVFFGGTRIGAEVAFRNAGML